MPRAACLANSHRDDTSVANNGIIANNNIINRIWVYKNEEARSTDGGWREKIHGFYLFWEIRAGKISVVHWYCHTKPSTQSMYSFMYHVCHTVPDLRTSSIADSA